jgi:uncharacterized surface protein with fasciclin (FAS1) repeats
MTLKQKLHSILFVTAIGTITTFSSCKKDDDPVPAPPPTPTPTVAGYVTSDTSFSILLAAVKKAGLDGTLNDATKTWTVFAPTNAAFRAIGYSVASVNAITTQADIDGLAAILTYHVLSTKVISTAVPASDAVVTVNTKSLFASRNSNGVFVNGVKVAVADVPVSNGVIHAIGSVLIPPTRTIAATVIAATTAPTPEFTLLLAAVSRAGLAGVLSGAGKYTVFAPTNAAFLATPYNTVGGINALNSTDSIALRKIILAHVLPTNVYSTDLSAVVSPINNTANPLASVSPQQSLTFAGTTVKITGSAAVVSNIITTSNGATFNITNTNGVVHVIDKVLL